MCAQKLEPCNCQATNSRKSSHSGRADPVGTHCGRPGRKESRCRGPGTGAQRQHVFRCRRQPPRLRAQRQHQRSQAVVRTPVLVLLLQLWPVRLGRPRRPDRPDQGQAGRPGQVDNSRPLPARLRRVPDPSRARGCRAVHVLRVLVGRENWGHHCWDRLCSPRFRVDALGQLPVLAGWL